MIDRTYRIPADATGGDNHTDPTGTIAHTGPVAGCTLPGCGAAPIGALAGREQRRRTTANILARIDRAKRILEDEATLLQTLVAAEQADGDQARALRFGAHDIEVCNQQRAAHTGLREALQSAFGVGDSVSDDDLFECVRQQAADLAAAKAGDAPWIRAYGEDIEHARRGEAEAVRARTAAEQRAEAMTRAMEDTAADALKHRGCHRDLMAQCQRAERAEATLTAVRKAVADAKNCAGEDAGCTVDHRDIITAILDNGPAALGDPQPATEPEACDAYQPATTAADSGLCANCGMYDHKHTAAAEPERPTVSVIDVLATALVAAGRRILRGETP